MGGKAVLQSWDNVQLTIHNDGCRRKEKPYGTNSFQQPQAAIVVQPAALTAIGSFASLMSVRVQPVSLVGFQPPPTAAVRQRWKP